MTGAPLSKNPTLYLSPEVLTVLAGPVSRKARAMVGMEFFIRSGGVPVTWEGSFDWIYLEEQGRSDRTGDILTYLDLIQSLIPTTVPGGRESRIRAHLIARDYPDLAPRAFHLAVALHSSADYFAFLGTDGALPLERFPLRGLDLETFSGFP